jgi:hypothetical protein
VTISTQPTFAVGTPAVVQTGVRASGNGRPSDMTPDGRRLGLVPADDPPDSLASARSIEVNLNWFEELKRRVPPK